MFNIFHVMFNTKVDLSMAKKARNAGRRPAAGREAEPAAIDAAEHPFDAVMKAAERSGLLKAKTSRIAGRVSPALVARAKKRTGIKSDSDLIAFALASLALEDDFAEAFRRARGTVDPDLKLNY